MKNGTGQLTLIIILMLAIFLQIEGVVPDLFAGNEEALILTGVNEGLEFSAAFGSNSFKENEEVTIAVAITNISSKSIRYYAGTTTYGIRAALGAELYSQDGKYKFTDKFHMETAGISSDAAVLEGELQPGKTINCEFTMLPYFFEEGSKNIAAAGEYMLRLWYNKDTQEAILAEFPITVVKRFGKIYLRG